MSKEWLQRHWAFPCPLQRQPWWVRLMIVIALFLIIFLFVLWLLLARHIDRGAVLLILPGLLTAWCFSRLRIAFAVQGAIMTIWIPLDAYTMRWSWPQWWMVLVGVITATLILLLVGGSRKALEMQTAALAMERQAKARTEEALAKERELLVMKEQVVRQQQELLEMKDQFISNASHELRTPLTAIDGYIELAVMVLLALDPEKLEKLEKLVLFLKNARVGCAELLRLVENLLQAMRADSDISPPVLTTFDLSITIVDLLRRLETVDHPICQEIESEVMVRADSQQVSQVLRNLVSNAHKYAPADTPVVVRLARAETEVVVSVQDQGKGIAPSQQSRLFQKFSRLPRDVAGSVRGSGLGLYLCERYVHGMNGRIWVESRGIEGEGSRFCFTVPLA